MKNLKSISAALLFAVASLTVSAQTKKINVSKSNIEWLGKKVTGQHNGTINFKDGAVVFKGKKLVGGSFTVDMNSLNTTDLKGEYQQKLNGHLKADDFFGTEKFPTATLVIKTIGTKSTNVYSITADITIKGITKPITFDMTVKGNTATTTLNVDRTKFGIQYGSKSFFDSIGDKAIYDDFELKVNLVF